MNIKLFINNKEKEFTAPFVPMAAKRKYLEIQAKAEERDDSPTAQELLDEETEMISILVDIVFKNQFTIDELVEGQSGEYIFEKLSEAIWGKKPKEESNDKENTKKK